MRTWIVYYHNFNSRQIKTFNIFEHHGFSDDVDVYLTKYKNKEEFAEKLKRSLMYYFWGKCEWETIITSFPTYISMAEFERIDKNRILDKEKYGINRNLGVNLETEIKIDVYNQVMNNWDIFLDYVWNSRIRRPRKVKWDENSVAFCNVCPKCGLVIERTAIKNNSGQLHYCPNCGKQMKISAEPEGD